MIPEIVWFPCLVLGINRIRLVSIREIGKPNMEYLATDVEYLQILSISSFHFSDLDAGVGAAPEGNCWGDGKLCSILRELSLSLTHAHYLTLNINITWQLAVILLTVTFGSILIFYFQINDQFDHCAVPSSWYSLWLKS